MFWKLEEARYVQERIFTSGPNAEALEGLPGVPRGKIWIVIAASYMPSVAETQNCSWTKITRSGGEVALLNPISVALNPQTFTFLEQGMECILLPGEYLCIRRSSHTVGSAMTARMQFIEIDLPLYSYEEPQIVKRHVSALSSIRTRLAGGRGGGGGGGGTVPSEGEPHGGGGGSLPK